MNSKKIEGTQIEYGSVQYTMLGPLWARATYTQKYPELLDDKKAVEIYNKVDIAETLSNLIGKFIKRISNSSVTFEDDETILFKNLSLEIVKPLIFW